ncbi:MAG: AMP-binding protein [Parachlamydiaceae bacterium]|nr:AMP-binding protein [Parachlamydiaceae bacterium]
MEKTCVDWLNEESYVFINQLLPEAIKELLKNAVFPHISLQGHVWLCSSGTENFPKMIALSKRALLVSAAGVNAHLKVNKGDSWLNVLPLFHTGGLAIHARAYLTGSEVWDFSEDKWDPNQYVKLLADHKIAFSSLTPTHVHDIVSLNLQAPKFLKSIVIGGEAFSEILHEKALALGWPLLRSYGMTELCSQIATSLSKEPYSDLNLLDHIEMKFDEEGFIKIKSEALLTGFVHGNDPGCTFINPKVEGWYKTQDKGSLKGGVLQIHGRGANFIKISGENVNFSQLESIWDNIKLACNFREEAVIVDLPDERLGRIVCLATLAISESDNNLQRMIDEFYKQVIPVARIRRIYVVSNIPRTELFKLKKNGLREMITL